MKLQPTKLYDACLIQLNLAGDAFSTLAYGFQTLSDDVAVSYLISAVYQPRMARRIRFDDPEYEINWPLPEIEISEKDLNWPAFSR